MTFPDAVAEALKNPKYSKLLDDRDNFINELTKRIWAWLIEMLRKLFGNIRQSDNLPELFSYNTNVFFAIAVSLITVIVITTIIVVIFAVRRRKRRRRYTEGIEEMFELLDNKSVSTLDLIKQSDLFAASGDFRSAVRYRYICLLWIMSKRVMTIAPSKVNSRIVREVESAFPDRFKGFRNIVNTYDYAWFGDKNLLPEEYETYIGVFDSVTKEAAMYEKA